MFRYTPMLMLLVLSVASAQTTNLRSLQEIVKVSEYYECVKENSECKSCPGSCMELVNNNTECMLKNCYSWNPDLGKCEESGPAFVPAIVLQSIPVTGVFGSGFGNMGRWDIFGVYMAIVFGPLTIVILACCLVMFGFAAQNEDRADCCKCCCSCFGCLWAVAIIVAWIWGIVVIANKSVLGPEETWYGATVRCALTEN